MRHSSEDSHGKVVELISRVKTIVHDDHDLNLDKEELKSIIKEIDFLIGKRDDLYAMFIDFFVSMGMMDFSKRIPQAAESEDSFVSFISASLNMVNEELEGVVTYKNNVTSVFELTASEDELLVITGYDGIINHVASKIKRLDSFSAEKLLGQNVVVLFPEYKTIQESLRGESSIRNIESKLKWSGSNHTIDLSISIPNSKGKIESVIYHIRLK